MYSPRSQCICCLRQARWNFFQTVIVSVLLYECTTWSLTKSMEKRLDDNYTRILLTVSNKSRTHQQNNSWITTFLPSYKRSDEEEQDMPGIKNKLIVTFSYGLPDIVLAVIVFANGPGDLDSIAGRVTPKTHKMILDASLLNTKHYKVRIKGKVKQSRERSSALPYTLV